MGDADYPPVNPDRGRLPDSLMLEGIADEVQIKVNLFLTRVRVLRVDLPDLSGRHGPK